MVRAVSGRLVRPRPLRRCVAPLLLAAAGGALAQSGGERAVSILPSASITQTVTNNALLNAAERRSDAITLLSAGIQLAGRSGRVVGSLDYQLSGSIHARSTAANNTANTLRASLNSELVDNWLFVDASASISQQAISAFGVQSTDLSIDNANRTEVRSYSISPSMRGRLGSSVNYVARLTHSQDSSANSDRGDTSGNSGSVSLNGALTAGVGWSLTGSRQRTSFSAGRSTTTDTVRAGLNYAVTPELRLSLDGGREDSDLVSRASQHPTTWGIGADWSPTVRTRLAVRRDRRFFGDSHTFSFDHRMAHSVWRFSSSRDLSTGSQQLVSGGTVALYDLYFANLAAQYPDPAARERAVLEQLARDGVSRNTVVGIGFLSSAVTLVNRQDMSVALQGLRTTLTLSGSRSDSRRLDELGIAQDDLSNSEHVRQRSFSVTLGHRLTPTSDLNLVLSKLRTAGKLSTQSSDLQSISLTWTGRLGPRGNLSMGARRVEFDSVSSPYDESAIFATLSMRF